MIDTLLTELEDIGRTAPDIRWAGADRRRAFIERVKRARAQLEALGPVDGATPEIARLSSIALLGQLEHEIASRTPVAIVGDVIAEHDAEHRTSYIARLMWNDGGNGLPGLGAAMAWDTMEPGASHPDWISVVAIKSPPEQYTTLELAKLVAFSEWQTAAYDRLHQWRMGANLICVDKNVETGWWDIKKLSWQTGSMCGPDLDELIETFNRRGGM